MHLKLICGVVGAGRCFMPGDVVKWNDDEDCKRFIARGIAVQASPHDIKAAEGKVTEYTPPTPRPEDAWPPGRLKPLKATD